MDNAHLVHGRRGAARVTYASFLALFVALPALAVALGARRRYRRGDLRALAATVVIVCAASFPWDSYAVRRGYWSFDPSRITGVRIGVLPVEECAFFVLETLLVAAVTLALVPRRAAGSPGA